MRASTRLSSCPRPSDPSQALATFRLFPGALARQDRELAWAHALEREEALRALHARGAALALEVHFDRSGAGTLSLLTHLQHRAAVMALWGPRILPWSWSLSPTAPSPPPPGSLIGTIGGATPRATSAPMRSSRSERSISPWTLILPSLRGPRREVRIRFVARPVGPSAPAATPRARHLPRGDRDTPLPLPPAHRLEREMEDLRGERAPGPYWECGGALAITGPGGRTPTKEEQHAVSSLWGAISGVPGGGSFQVRWVRGEGGLRKWAATTRLDLPRDWFRVLGLGQAPALVTPAELMLWLPPWDARRTPGLRSLPSPGTRDLRVGTDPAGERVVWSMARGEGHHLTVAGETGMGKSTLLQRLAADAIADGRTSLIVVDPLGETAQGVLHLLSPAARSRAVWVAPLRSPVGINALELPTGLIGANARAERERRVSELVTALRRVRAERYGETVYWGPRIEDLLTRTFLVLSACPGSTLRDAHELLSEPDRWVGPLSSQDEGGREALALWESIRREGPEERQGALRIVQEVALSSAISRLLASRAPRWSLSRALEPGAVTFFDLERTAIGVRASSYLGAALLSLLWSFLLARKDRGKVLLILDEVQEYANDALSEMLRLGRRYNLHVLSATQSLASLPDSLRDSLVTNSRDLVLFRGSAGDARLVHEGLGVGREFDLTSLPRGMALALLEKGAGATLVRTPLPTSLPDRAAAERAELAECLARSRAFWSPEEEVPPGRAELRFEAAPGGLSPPAAAPGPSSPSPVVARPPVVATDPCSETSGPLLALLVAALEAPEGEPFPVELPVVRRLCREDERVLRRVGAALKGCSALQRTEKRDGVRVWWLLREPLQELVAPPWDPRRLSEAREAWERARSTRLE